MKRYLLAPFSWERGSGGFNPNLYLAVRAVMSPLPDFAFILFPLCRRSLIACHHDITRTLVFILAASGASFVKIICSSRAGTSVTPHLRFAEP